MEQFCKELEQYNKELEKELDKLQADLRGKNVAELSDNEFAEFCQKSERVTEIMNELFEFKKL